MRSTIPFVCVALVGTAASAQRSFSQPIEPEQVASSPVGEVFFAFDSAELPDDLAALQPIVAWAEAHPSGRIVLDGNACSIGAGPYNVRLSAQRTESVREQLVALGVDDDRIVLAFYGEDGPRRATRARDRRVTIWTTHDPLHAIVDQTFEHGTAVLWRTPVTYAELYPTAPDQVATR